MNRVTYANIVRFVIITLLQVLVLKGINLNSGTFHFFHFIIYPIVILLLPIDIQRVYALLIAFCLGFTIDMFYDSPGLHAAAITCVAYARPFVLKWLEPRGGYTSTVPGLGNFEFGWVVSYLSIMFFLFFTVYFSLEAFSFVFFAKTILNIFFSFIVSMAIVILYQIIVRPKY